MWIEDDMSANSPKVFDDEDDPMMEAGYDDTVSNPSHGHAGFTMEQAHFNAAMTEEQPAPAPMSVFQHALEEQRYNLFLLK